MKKINLLFILVLIAVSSHAQKINVDEEIVRRIADNILNETKYGFVSLTNWGQEYEKATDVPEGEMVRFASSYIGWYYPNGVINMAMVDLGTYLNEEKYKNHTVKMVNFGLENAKEFEKRFKPGTRERGYPYREIFLIKELDDCGAMGACAIEAYRITKDQEIMDYLEKVADHILNKQDRLKDKSLVRKFPHEMTLWADDLYMSVPFLARMGNLTGENKYLEDGVLQVLKFNEYLWDEDKGLYYHCYYNDLKRNGVAHWGRCNGWVMMANVHLLNYLPESHPKRKEILKNLEKQILGIAKYQNENGVWHQLLDKNDSYIESSCTAMFTYCIARAVNEGWIDKRYASIALAGWEGLKNEFITHEGLIKDVCVGTGIEDNLVFYYNRPKRLNESHGLGAVIEAGIEIMRLNDTIKK